MFQRLNDLSRDLNLALSGDSSRRARSASSSAMNRRPRRTDA